MYLVGHVAAGALIGQQLSTSPELAFTMGFVSHFLLDLIPHGDKHHVVDYYGSKTMLKALYNVLVIDSTLAIVLVAGLLAMPSINRFTVACGIVGSVLPDFLVGLGEKVHHPKLKKFTKFHFIVHNALIHKINVSRLHGTIVQIAIVAAMLAAL